MWKLPHDNRYASYRRDNNDLYELVLNRALKSATLLEWFKSNGADGTRDGRKGTLSIQRCCEGTDASVEKCATLRKSLNDARWTGYGSGLASGKLVASVFKLYSEFSGVGKEFTELEKMEAFQTSSKPMHDLLGSTCHKAVEDKVLDFIRRLKRGEEYDADGRELTFAEFTSFLIDEEKRWLRIQKSKKEISQVSTKDSPTISSTNTSSNTSSNKPKKKKAPKGNGNGYNSHQTWNKETGEPTHHWVNCIDVSILYRDTGKIEEDEFKQLPNVCKDYFRKQPNQEMPSKFKDMKQPFGNKSKKSKK